MSSFLNVRKREIMSIIRVNKNKNYTTMSNYHLRDNRLSLKAKGLLSEMLSLPEGWDYSISGLVVINKENETSIKSTLDELKKNGYLIVSKLLPNETDTGRIKYVYDIYEEPKQEGEKQGVENLGVVFLGVENQAVENQGQINTNNKNTNNKNTNNKIKIKHKYGEYQNVLLTDKELQSLKSDYDNSDELIKYLDEYIEMKGYKAKSHYLCIKKWVIKAVKENKKEEDYWNE